MWDRQSTLDGDCRFGPEDVVNKIGGEGWIRTSVRLRGQIYSLLPLTTRPPLHEVMQVCTGQAGHVAGPALCVNALPGVELSPLGFASGDWSG